MDYKIDAREAMDAFYGAGNWSYRTAPKTGSDLGAALNAAMTAQRVTYPRLDVLIPPTGPWYMATPIADNLVTGCHIRGDGGPFGTTIHYDSDANFLNMLYTGDAYEGGYVENLMVSLEPGHPNGGAFAVVAAQNSLGAPCGYMFERLRVGAAEGSSWNYHFCINGMNRTSPQGIRGLVIRDGIFFNARLGGLWAVSLNQAVIDNVGFCVPNSAVGADVFIGGDTPENKKSYQIYVNGLVAGRIALNNVYSIAGNMKSLGLTVNSTVAHAGIIHDGPVTGSVGSGFVTQF